MTVDQKPTRPTLLGRPPEWWAMGRGQVILLIGMWAGCGGVSAFGKAMNEPGWWLPLLMALIATVGGFRGWREDRRWELERTGGEKALAAASGCAGDGCCEVIPYPHLTNNRCYRCWRAWCDQHKDGALIHCRELGRTVLHPDDDGDGFLIYTDDNEDGSYCTMCLKEFTIEDEDAYWKAQGLPWLADDQDA